MKRYYRQLMPDRRALVLFECLAIFLGHWVFFHSAQLRDFVPGGVDGYYHYAVSSLLSFTNPWQDIDFLPFTYMGQNGTDHQWLFHWILKPFTLLEWQWRDVIQPLFKKAAELAKGSEHPGRETAGSVTKDQVREIAEIKMNDLSATDMDAAMRIIEGTARSAGITVED